MAVSDYSTTPASNTAISGLTVTDSTIINAVDDIIRQMMADIRSFYDVTALINATATITGAWTFSGTPNFTNSIGVGTASPLAMVNMVSTYPDIRFTDTTLDPTLDYTQVAYSGATYSVAIDPNSENATPKFSVAIHGTPYFNLQATGLQLGATGARITSFSNDATSASKSATLGVTENGAKTYADSLVSSILFIKDQQTSGTDGQSLTAATWNTRTLNTVGKNSITGASLAANQFTLPAGSYKVMATANGYSVGRHKIRIYNITDSSNTAIGTSSNANGTYTAETSSSIFQFFTIAAAKVFELQHYVTTTQSNGGGLATSSGAVEEYAQVWIEKIA